MRESIGIVGLVAVGFLAATAVAAADRVTLIMSDGTSISGTPSSSRASNDRDRGTRTGELNLVTDDGRGLRVRLDEVAVVDFGGRGATAAEIAALPAGNGQFMVLRSGAITAGRFIAMTDDGDTVRWETQNGRQQTMPVRELVRIYLNSASARTMFDSRNERGGRAGGRDREPRDGDRDQRSRDGGGDRRGRSFEDANDSRFGGGNRSGRGAATVRVEASQAWTGTGVTVRAGDRVTFQPSGVIRFGPEPAQTSSPDGNQSWKSADYPVAGMPAGSLVGRVDNGAAFMIGSTAQAIRMPANGTLMLGVNDNLLGDNSGFFSVVVTPQD